MNKKVHDDNQVKLAVIGSVGVPASYGGFETLVEQLIGDNRFDYTVYCSAVHYMDRLGYYKGAKLIYLPMSANGIASIFYDALSIIHALLTGHKKLLVLGTSGALIFPLVRLIFPSVKLVTNIDGLEWSRSKWSRMARGFLRLSESFAVNFSSIVVADNKAIAEYIHKRYGRDCETIAYGGDHAVVDLVSSEDIPYVRSDRQFALAICRIEPENNVHVVLEAFLGGDDDLIFIGNWQASDYGRTLHCKYGDHDNVHLLDPIYDIISLGNYRKNCYVYIHGHSAGGTNPSLVEMMHFAKPIIAFDCKYNRASMEDCGYYFETSAHLRAIIEGMERVSDPAMRGIALKRYTWAAVRMQYGALFN